MISESMFQSRLQDRFFYIKEMMLRISVVGHDDDDELEGKRMELDESHHLACSCVNNKPS